jgi:uncharacterized membrane protein (UPF0127 family)
VRKFFFLSFLVISGCWSRNLDQNQKKFALVYLGNITVKAEIASQPEEKQKGLGGRNSLAKNEAMLFLFDTPHQPAFWMKGMKFPLDFIWLNNSQIVDLHYSVPPPKSDTPDSQLPRIVPASPADALLEVNAGFIIESKVKIGDSVKINLE